MLRPLRRPLLFVAIAAAIFTSMVAFASKLGTSNRVRADETLRTLDASPYEELKEPVDRARELLRAANTHREKGDEKHAEAFDRAARAWAEYAVTLAEVEALEHRDAGVAKSTAASARAELEQATEQNARLRIELERLENDLRSRDAGVKSTKRAAASKTEAP